MPQADDHPNLEEEPEPESAVIENPTSPTKKPRVRRTGLSLQQSDPIFETNRCTVVIEHGDPYALRLQRITPAE